MVHTITPVVHGGNRRRWAASVTLHVLGATVSAAAFGAALGGTGLLLGAPWGGAGLLLAAAAAALYAARELVGLPIPVPERRRQVPEWWRTFFPPPVAAFLYGTGLGVGFLTFVRHGTLAAVAVAAVAWGDPVTGAVAVGAFGLARATTLVLVTRARTADDVSRVVDRLDRLAGSRLPAAANGVALAAMTAILAWTALPVQPLDAGPLPAAALAMAFAWSAGAKLLGPRRWRATMEAHGLGPRLTGTGAVAVPGTELAVPLLVVAGQDRIAGMLAAILLLAFSAAVVRLRLRTGTRVPCGCFGGHRARDYRILLVRNAALLSVSLAAVLAGTARVGLVLRAPSPHELIPAALTILAAGLGAWIVRRSRLLARTR
jgi:hypothetical protein